MHSPAHPGRHIADELAHLAVSVADGAKALGITRSQLYRVIKGDSAVTPEMAVRLEQAIGSTADHWLRLQAAYDLTRVRSAKPPIKLQRISSQAA
jgi:addiction module HigA family antidote